MISGRLLLGYIDLSIRDEYVASFFFFPLSFSEGNTFPTKGKYRVVDLTPSSWSENWGDEDVA